jgi:hypothetical protein
LSKVLRIFNTASLLGPWLWSPPAFATSGFI